MNADQIKMLRFIIKQEIEAAGIDGLYDHGAAAWAERMLDESWEEFQQSLLMPDEKIWLKKKLNAEDTP